MTMMNVQARTLAARLKTSRELAGMDQDEIAARIGTSRGAVSSWERGLTEPRVSQLISWAAEVGQTVEALIEGLEPVMVRSKGLEPPTF